MIIENDGRTVIMTDAEALRLIAELTELVSRGLNGSKMRHTSMSVMREKPEQLRNSDATLYASMLHFHVLTEEQYKTY